MDEDTLQHHIYLLTFVESLEIIFSQYKETCELLPGYPKIGGENIKEFAKEDIRNILRANIDVHSRRINADFSGYGIKCIEKLQSPCAIIIVSNRSRYDRNFQKLTHKLG